MRDGSIDYETGWLYNGWYDRCAPDLSTGVAGLGADAPERAINLSNVPAAGRRYIKQALRDPQARPILEDILTSSSDPSSALARQVDDDLAEALHPTGKVVVFKALVGKLVPRLRAVENALVRATDPNTREGYTAAVVAATAGKADAQEFLTNLALATLAPDAQVEREGLPDELSGLGYMGKSIFKKAKQAVTNVVKKVEQTAHNPNVRKAYVAAAVIGAVAITGGAILPALSTAATVAGAGAAGTMKKPAAPAADAGTPAPVWDPVRGEYVTPVAAAAGGAAAGGGLNLSSVAGMALDFYKLKQTGEIAKAGILHQQMVDQLKAQGLSDAQAQLLAQRAESEAQQQYGPQQAAPQIQYVPGPGGQPAPAEASIIDPTMVKYGLIGFTILGTIYGISLAFKGGSRRGRRR